MIRKAEPIDFSDIIYLAELFWQDTEFTDPFDPVHVYEMIKLSYDCGLLAVAGDVGFIAGVHSPLLGSGSVRIAAELAYYVKPENRGIGVRLLKFYETLVREQGIKYSSMMSLQSCEPSKANKLYERLGYHHSETTYLKVM